jgi:hypothetical protein
MRAFTHIINKNPGAMVVATGAKGFRLDNTYILQHIDGDKQVVVC